MVAEGLADLEDGSELVMADAPDASALIRSPGNLDSGCVPRTQLADGALECD